MRASVLNRLTQLRQLIAVRRGSPEGFLGWVAVLPLSDGGYRVMAFDLPAHVVEADVDPVGHETNTAQAVATSLDDALRLVAEMGADPDSLEVPWAVDYPL